MQSEWARGSHYADNQSAAQEIDDYKYNTNTVFFAHSLSLAAVAMALGWVKTWKVRGALLRKELLSEATKSFVQFFISILNGAVQTKNTNLAQPKKEYPIHDAPVKKDFFSFLVSNDDIIHLHYISHKVFF